VKARRQLDVIKHRIRLVLTWLTDTFFLRGQSGSPAERQVLVLRLDHLGDFTLWLPAARALRDLFPRPEYRIVLLANRQWASWARQLGIFDTVWAADRRKLARSRGYRAAWLRRLRRSGFGVVLNPLLSREFSLGDLLVRATGATRAIGLRADRPSVDGPLLTLGERWYSTLVEAGEAPVHELHLNAAFAKALGVDLALPVASWLGTPDGGGVGALPTPPYIVVSPGSSDLRKNWPASRFVEVLKRLRGVTDWSTVVCGGPGEDALGQRLASEFGGNVVNLAGRTTLAQLGTVIGGAALVLTTDSGPAHLAVALGVPSVAIVGGGHPGRFLPYPASVAAQSRARYAATHLPCYGCKWACRFEVAHDEPFPCVEQVTVEQVWQQVAALLEDAYGLRPNDSPTRTSA
jgi:ADP-heptose:LPS heptosyltransferase